MEYKKIGVLLFEELNPTTKSIINMLKMNGYALCIDESEEGVAIEILDKLS